MCINMEKYISRSDSADISLLSSSYKDACKDSTTDHVWSSARSIMALADVNGVNIQTYYPPMYGKGHLAYKTLNTV